jgi:hypothetical protein
MFGLGSTELLILVSLFSASGGLLGLPLSTPPLPPDPAIARAAPDECLMHVTLAGLAAAEAGSGNLTERMLADPEMRDFLERVAAEIMRVGRQAAPAPPEMSTALGTVLEAMLTRPVAISLERFVPASPEGPPEVRASLVLRPGDQAGPLGQALATLTAEIFSDAPPQFLPRPVTVAGRQWQRIETPLGPFSWGLGDGSLIATIGPGTLESLLARLGAAARKQPVWQATLEQRLPVNRRSTLAYFNAGAALRIAMALPAAERDESLAVLEATGIAGLDTIGATSGMSAEGVASSIWLGFQGKPKGIFAAPSTGIGPRQLARIPADATLAQIWSLDLSESLALAIKVAAAGDPQAAVAFREGLEQFRAVAGFDIDAHLLRPLGPDWTVISVPAPGGLLPNLAVVAGVRDRPTLARTHTALLGVLRNAAAGGEIQVEIREIPYRGQTLYCLQAAGEGMAFPISPSWCLTDDSLVVALSPQLLKTLLARDAAAGGIGGVAEVKRALAGGEPTLVGLLDPVALVGTLCGLYEMAAPVARGMLREQGLDLDLPQLPPSSAIMPFARPSVSTIRHQADGIVLENTGTIPLGPLTAGGGVLGLSPASAPVLVGLFLPAVQSAREAARRAATQNNFRQVLLAMLNYEAVSGRLPPQAICDKDGKPLLSWRVAMLPFIEEGELHGQFRLDEPWDSEHNLKLLERMPTVYADPSAPPEQAARGLTTIQVLTGKETPFAEPGRGLRAGAISDGMSKTIAIVEALPENAVPWTKPADLPFQADRPLAGVGNPQRAGGLFVVGMFDGSTRMVAAEVDPGVFKALVTPSGGEAIDLD